MRKSFIIIVVISVSSIISLILALYFAPLRTSLTDYSNSITQEGLSKIGVSYSAIEKAHRTTSTPQIAVKGFDVPLAAQSEKKRSVSPRIYNNLIGFKSPDTYKVGYAYVGKPMYSVSGMGSDGLVVTNTTNKSAVDANGINIGIIPVNNSNSTGNLGLRSNEFLTTTTDLSAGSSTPLGGGKQGAGGGPPPDETGTPSLPIGDGTLLLLAFSTLFVIVKFRNTTL